MSGLKEKFLTKIEKKGDKKSIENLVVFVIILIATIIFINYIWNGNKKETKEEQKQNVLANTTVNNNIIENNSNNLEYQIENILKKLDGVDDVNVLITYEETNKVIPMYNEDIQENITKEEDTQGGVRTINESSSKKEVVYEENNGKKSVVTSSVITPEIKGAVIIAKGANNSNVKSNIIQAVEAATGLPTHKIQVFEMKN
nr:hypothetical protein [Clostridia bacterium]